MRNHYAGISALLGLIVFLSITITLLPALERRDRLLLRIQAATAPYRQAAGSGGPQSAGVALAEVSQGIGRRLAQMFGFIPGAQNRYPLPRWLTLIGTLLGAFAVERVITMLIGPLTLLAVLPLWLMFSRGFFKWCETRRRQKLFSQFPDALAMIARAVRVGIPVSDAIRAVGGELAAPTGPEFGRVADELGIGAVLEDALRSLAERTGLAEYRFFAAALTLQAQTGGGLTETLDMLAEVIRKRVAVRQRALALSSEALTSATVLALLPPAAGLGLWVFSPHYLDVLFTDPLGRKLLAAAVASLACGAFVMRLIIQKSLT